MSIAGVTKDGQSIFETDRISGLNLLIQSGSLDVASDWKLGSNTAELDRVVFSVFSSMFERYPNISIESSLQVEADLCVDEKLQLSLEFDVAKQRREALFMGTLAYVSVCELSSLGPTK